MSPAGGCDAVVVAPAAPAVLFDLDGCLVDSTLAITNCLNHALSCLGLPAREVDDLRRFIGPPLREGLGVLLAEAGASPALVGEAVAHYRQRYAHESLACTQVVSGIPEVLEQLSPQATLAVVTSKPSAFAVPILRQLNLMRWFAGVHGPRLDAGNEPKRVTLERARNATFPDTPPWRMVMVGDRRHDVDAGAVHALWTAGVTWGAGDAAELAAAGADVIVDAPEQLPDAVTELLSRSRLAGR